VGLVVAVSILPSVVLSPFFGVYVDRWPRRTILLVTNVVEGLLVAALSGLILAHALSFPAILAVVAALGAGGQVVRLTSTTLIPQTVGAADLGAANGLMQLSSSSTQVVGLSIGGVVVALFGVTLPIAYDALTFFAAAVIVAGIAAAVGRPGPAEAAGGAGFGAQFAEGFRYVRGQRFLLEVIAVGAVVNFCGNAVFALWAPYSERVLGGGAATYGLLGAMIAVGAIVGALAVGKIDLRRRVGPVVFAGLAVAGVVIVLLGLTRSIPLALAEAFAVGGVLSVVNVPLLTAVQAKVPARLLGRTMAVLLALILVAAPLGSFVAGWLASVTSIGFVYVLAGGAILAMAGLGVSLFSEARRIAY